MYPSAYFKNAQSVKRNSYILRVNGLTLRVRASFSEILTIVRAFMAEQRRAA